MAPKPGGRPGAGGPPARAGARGAASGRVGAAAAVGAAGAAAAAGSSKHVIALGHGSRRREHRAADDNGHAGYGGMRGILCPRSRVPPWRAAHARASFE